MTFFPRTPTSPLSIVTCSLFDLLFPVFIFSLFWFPLWIILSSDALAVARLFAPDEGRLCSSEINRTKVLYIMLEEI